MLLTEKITYNSILSGCEKGQPIAYNMIATARPKGMSPQMVTLLWQETQLPDRGPTRGPARRTARGPARGPVRGPDRRIARRPARDPTRGPVQDPISRVLKSLRVPRVSVCEKGQDPRLAFYLPRKVQIASMTVNAWERRIDTSCG